MYAEIDHADHRAPDAAPSSAWRTEPHMSRPLTPPRLHAVDPAATQAVSRLTIADLRLPAELVRARATQYTTFARAQGAQHSMRLWRSGYQQAILSLVREAAGVADNAPCLAFFWQQQSHAFMVSATFGQPPLLQLH